MWMTMTSVALFSLWIACTECLNQLSFSGGGSFGALEIGILKRIHETDPKRYDLYTGISAGALNAGFLSYYSDVHRGIQSAERIYSSIRSRMVYEALPTTGLSLLNTRPLHQTLTEIIASMPNQPVVHTLMGATNLYSGQLDVYTFEEQNQDDKVSLMMSSCAIPGMFPPIQFNGQLYADGGTLSNELIDVEHDNTYLNVTFITPFEDFVYSDAPIASLRDMLCRTVMIVLNNFNNPMATLNQNCRTTIGEINKYYVPAQALKGYDMLNFDHGQELVDIGYKHMLRKRYKIC
jgi:NTE family protein